MSHRHIVKVQRPLVTNGPANEVLVYNEDRSIMAQLDAPKELRKMFRGDYKMYCEATVQADGILAIDRRVKEQNW